MKRRAAAGWASAFLSAALTVPACGSHASQPAPPVDAESDGAHGAGPIVVDRTMLASITVEPIAERDMTSVLTIAGKVQFDEDRLARVLVPLGGQVVDLHVKVGDPVKKGETLCAIRSREAAAAVAEHIESHKDLDLAEKTAVMTEDLFQHEAASKIALQQAQNDLAKARSRVTRTEDALRVFGLDPEADFSTFTGRVPIVAPIGGVVIDRKVTEGQFVQADSTPIVSVADLSTVWVMGDLFERDLPLASIGQSATITTTAYGAETFQGRVNYISDAIDPATRTAKVRVSVANPGARLKPEMFAAISLEATGHRRVMTIPAAAVFVEDGRSYVYTEIDRGTFVRRAVDVAAGEGSERRVLGGLRAGERIVVDGALLLRQREEKRAG
jgi:cobalt-zinc-cadmium efflux system membrane fusion protein